MNTTYCGTCGFTHQTCAGQRPRFADTASCCCDQPVQVKTVERLSAYAKRQKIQPETIYSAILRNEDAAIVDRDGLGVCLWLGSECEEEKG